MRHFGTSKSVVIELVMKYSRVRSTSTTCCSARSISGPYNAITTYCRVRWAYSTSHKILQSSKRLRYSLIHQIHNWSTINQLSIIQNQLKSNANIAHICCISIALCYRVVLCNPSPPSHFKVSHLFLCYTNPYQPKTFTIC